MIIFVLLMIGVAVFFYVTGYSLSKGNTGLIEGDNLEEVEDKEGYAKAISKPFFVLGTAFLALGALSMVISDEKVLMMARITVLMIFLAGLAWVWKIKNQFKQ
ncbi:MAG: hypothetical protein K6A30_08285 [Lachnospiraceae bacterium]|nr:hypothetical protein [Lachnospiraceae bacterium]